MASSDSNPRHHSPACWRDTLSISPSVLLYTFLGKFETREISLLPSNIAACSYTCLILSSGANFAFCTVPSGNLTRVRWDFRIFDRCQDVKSDRCPKSPELDESLSVLGLCGSGRGRCGGRGGSRGRCWSCSSSPLCLSCRSFCCLFYFNPYHYKHNLFIILDEFHSVIFMIYLVYLT